MMCETNMNVLLQGHYIGNALDLKDIVYTPSLPMYTPSLRILKFKINKEVGIWISHH